MKLVVIEGAGKKETIEKHLGKGYKVFATKGHIRDLPAKSLAVNVKKNFEPKYAIMDDKKDIAESLKSLAAKSEQVLLATDPDREGEAISWHVANILDIPETAPVRIEFNEISKKAVQKALENPRKIDMDLVDAQQARRVLDRLVGYKLSPILCKKIQNKLSAGRVQSVTLKLVVDREREIRSFIPQEYWPFFTILDKSKESVKATLSTKNNKKLKLTCKEEVEQVVKDLENQTYKVTKVKKSITKSKPPAPFITSSMQQDALNKLGMSLKQTTLTAQGLYEGVELGSEGKVALVTYIRTDSTRVSEDAMIEAKEFIVNRFGKDYVPPKFNVYTSKKNANVQDAHEAIRPIDITRTPDSLKDVLKKEHYKLYKLIYERFLASQMSEAQYNSLSVDINAGEYCYKVTGRTPLFAGYTAVYNAFVDETEEKDPEKEEDVDKLPDLNEGDILTFVEHKYEQKFTKPPARYTEASLVKTMEEIGIGRPATYTPTISLLSAREYTDKDGRYILPTELGEKVTDMLVKYFPDIMDVEFTANMEEKLDTIEDGGVVWQSVVANFYEGFEEKIAAAQGDSFSLKVPDVPTDYICPECGANMVIKSGRFGKFLACPSYPKCKHTMHLDEKTGKPVEQQPNSQEKSEAQESDVICDKCGKTMVIKQGRFGPFLACPGYPKCKNIKSLPKEGEEKEDLPPCPICGKDLKKIVTKRSTFYGCSSYPDCNFTSSQKPVEGKCPECGEFLVEKIDKDGNKTIKCSSKTCNHVQE